MKHMAFVADRRWLANLLFLTYQTSMMQVALVVVALALTGQTPRLRIYLALFAATATTTIIISAMFPTVGTYEFYSVPDWLLPHFPDPRAGWDQVAPIKALRAGTMRVIPLDDIHGLVSFPSFHTALAIITTWALMRTRFAAQLAFALNLPLILATPTNGSHYLCDILGGAVIAFAALAVFSGFEKSPAKGRVGLASTEPALAG
jgi:hypothetical protein